MHSAIHSVALLKILYLMNKWEELEKLAGWQWPVSFLSTYCIFLVDTSERGMSDNIAIYSSILVNNTLTDISQDFHSTSSGRVHLCNMKKEILLLDDQLYFRLCCLSKNVMA